MTRLPLFLCTATAALLLSACGTPPPAPPDPEGWHEVRLPGKTATLYAWEQKEGRRAVCARADRSASMWRRHLQRPAHELGEVSFSWWVQEMPTDASVAEAAREDASARVIFAFQGDVSRLPLRTRALFELAEALTGERPPYATLMYVWDAKAPVGTVIVNPRSDRIRKIVLDSGPQHLGRWRDHRRNLADDFRLAFGEEPGALTAVALMTDSDNTGSRAVSWFGPLQLH
jgi:hypothetical protein